MSQETDFIILKRFSSACHILSLRKSQVQVFLRRQITQTAYTRILHQCGIATSMNNQFNRSQATTALTSHMCAFTFARRHQLLALEPGFVFALKCLGGIPMTSPGLPLSCSNMLIILTGTPSPLLVVYGTSILASRAYRKPLCHSQIAT